MHLIRKLYLVGELDVAILHLSGRSHPEVRSFQLRLASDRMVALARHLPPGSSLETLCLSDLTNLPFVTSSALNADTPGLFDLYALRQHTADGSGFGIAVGNDESAWDTAVIRSVADRELRLGTGPRGAEKPRMTPPCSGRSAGCATSTGDSGITERPAAIAGDRDTHIVTASPPDVQRDDRSSSAGLGPGAAARAGDSMITHALALTADA